ncbi:MAG: SpoIIE family protein phosphatase [Candidatus Delongbacteria bacterium]|nr:SpoIIE family protein phosphatase [Candidatus Delongbacteria bacterium]
MDEPKPVNQCTHFLDNHDECLPLKISLLLNSSLDLNLLLSMVMQITTETMQVEASSLLLYQQNKNRLTFEISLGPKGEQLHHILLPSDKGIVGQVIRSRQSMVVNDVRQSLFFNPEIDRKTGFVTRSILCVPLIYQDQIRGAIEVINKLGGRDFQDGDVKLLESIAVQVVLSLENAQLFNRVSLQARQKTILYNFGKLLAPILNQGDIIRQSTETLQTLVEYDELWIVQFMDSSHVRFLHRAASGSEFDFSAYLQREELTDQGCLTHDPEGDCMAVPLSIDHRIRGLIVIRSRQSGIYDEDQLSLLYHFAALVASALERSENHLKDLEQERMNKTIQFARQIQQSLLPEHPLKNERIWFYASYIPCLQISGDYYDYIPIDQDRYFFLIADAAGKGASAAMMMSAARAAIHLQLEQTSRLSDIAATTNHLIAHKNEEGLFITAFLGIVDLKLQNLEFINCGHNPPYLIRSGSMRALSESFLPLGISEDTPYAATRLGIQSGDHLFCYTDGVIDSRNSQRNLYGDKRLKDFLNRRTGSNIDQLHRYLINELETFTRDMVQSDDITFMSIKIL